MKPWAHRALFLLTLILANLFLETFSEVNNQTMTVKKLGSLLENFGQQLLQLKNKTDIANDENQIDMKNLKNTVLKLVNTYELYKLVKMHKARFSIGLV